MNKHILVTNDDGVLSPGLLALAHEMRILGRVSVLAPDRNWSGGGHVKTLDRALRVREFLLADGTTAFGSDGAPSDCVALAMLGYFKEPIDLVVSGINVGANLGHDVTYSGTVAAAMEGTLLGVPSIAFSLAGADHRMFTEAGRVARMLAELVLREGLPRKTLLNVNIPAGLPKGIRFTRLGHRVYSETVRKEVDPRGKAHYWVGAGPPLWEREEDSDMTAVHDGYVSVTPLHMDLTDHQMLQKMAGWQDALATKRSPRPGKRRLTPAKRTGSR